MPYLDKENLVKYVIQKYYEMKNLEISPVKLQKTMYLLYAMWAGNARNVNVSHLEGSEGISEFQQLFQEDLFEPNFEAWRYGPVDRDIYRRFKFHDYQDSYANQATLDLSGAEGLESTISSFINSILTQVFEISDFSLVDLTHKDSSWDKIYKQDPTGKTIMKKEDIIDEYAARLKKNKAD